MRILHECMHVPPHLPIFIKTELMTQRFERVKIAWLTGLLLMASLRARPLEGSFLRPYHRSHCPLTKEGQNHQGSHCLVA